MTWLGMSSKVPSIQELFYNFAYLIFFAVNFQTLLGQMNDYSSAIVGHFWSLAVEEQFYLIWAPLLLIFRKNTLILILIMCAAGYATTIHQPFVFNSWFRENAELSPVFFTTNRFFHFGLGAAIAMLVVRKQLLELPLFVSVILQTAFILPVVSYLFGHHFYHMAPERIVNGLISAGLILMAITKHSIFPFEINWLKYLGKVSFGIYIFHMFAIRLSFKLLSETSIEPTGFLFQAMFPFLATIFAVAMAVVSYEVLEKRFLALKQNYK